MISTANYPSLPNKQKLQQICKAISVADAILSPEWQYRYYSYNSKWSDGEKFCEMRNGSGDQMLILFHVNGCVINGMCHEFYPKNKSMVTNGLPDMYKEFIFGEPVNSIGTTFCLWTDKNSAWKIGDLDDFSDGSEEMMAIFDGEPQTYIEWAINYYEDGLSINANTYQTLSFIYAGGILTKAMIYDFVENFEDWGKLKADLAEIDYPFQFD